MPNQLLLTDIPPQAGGAPTEHGTAEGKVYMCCVKDAFSNKIVGYSTDSRMEARLAVAALGTAVVVRGDLTECIVRSDRGSQFRSKKHQRVLTPPPLGGILGASGLVGTTPPWRALSASCRRTSSTVAPGPQRHSCARTPVTWTEGT